MVIVWLLLGCAAAYGLTRVALGYPRPGHPEIWNEDIGC